MLHRWHLRHRKKRGTGVGNTKRGKGTKIMAIADGAGLPLSAYATEARPNEVRLVEPTIDHRFTKQLPVRLVADKGYDSDPLDRRLKARGIELIAPHRYNRILAPTQDGRPLRRMKRRWKIERCFAWLFNWRRIPIRYEYYLENFQGLVHLACIMVLIKHCL